MRSDEIAKYKNAIYPIAQKYGLDRVFIFGSVARGEENADSDVDLRIDKGKLKGYIAMCCLYSDIEKAFDRKIDLLTTESLSQSFLKDIKDEEVLIYDAFA